MRMECVPTLKKTVDPDYKLFLLTLIYAITWGIYIYMSIYTRTVCT